MCVGGNSALTLTAGCSIFNGKYQIVVRGSHRCRMLVLRNITMRYGSIRALASVSLMFRLPGLYALVGPSGSGKSTLLRVMAGIENPTEGVVEYDGSPVVVPNDLVGFVFQNSAIYPHLTVEENLWFYHKVHRLVDLGVEERAEEIVETLSIAGIMGKRPSSLSGGELQRVAIGRALMRSPPILLLDEPLSNLDFRLRAQVRDLIFRVHNIGKGITIVVTHDDIGTLMGADEVLVLEEGRVVQMDRFAAIMEKPTSDFANYMARETRTLGLNGG